MSKNSMQHKVSLNRRLTQTPESLIQFVVLTNVVK
jgi:hypothetical protein